MPKLNPDVGKLGSFCQKQSNGAHTCPVMDFGVPDYNSSDPTVAIAAKCYWARSRGIYWKGITDAESPCDRKSPTNDSMEEVPKKPFSYYFG